MLLCWWCGPAWCDTWELAAARRRHRGVLLVVLLVLLAEVPNS